MTVDQLKQEVLKLSADERVRLAEWIAMGLDVEAELERSWLAEVRRRDEELEAGTVTSVPMDRGLASVRERFGW